MKALPSCVKRCMILGLMLGSMLSAVPPAALAAGGDGAVDAVAPVELAAPTIAAPAVGFKSETIGEVRYLFLDLDPVNGMTLNSLKKCMVYGELEPYPLELSIPDNDGSGLIRTGDKLTVSAYGAKGVCVARVTEVIIVMGDANCNGKVNSSDAAVLKDMNFGAQYSVEAALAADVNFSGTLAAPKANSSDAAYIMNKCFAWSAGKYESNLQ